MPSAARVQRFLCLKENIEEAALLLAEARASERLGARPEPIERRALETLLPHEAVHQGLALEAKPLDTADLEDVLAAISC